MIYFLLLLILGAGEAAGACWVMWTRIGAKAAAARKNAKVLDDELEKKRQFIAKVEAILETMVDVAALRERADEFRVHRESLKAERGRITITQAELETVESRLRELEEIERELEASAVETKEEINILTKKKDELQQKNESLREELSLSTQKLQDVMSEIEISAQMVERIEVMKTDLVRTQEQIDQLLEKVQEGNEQYFILKQRYDALDIEYAQLYEKFSAGEMAPPDEGH